MRHILHYPNLCLPDHEQALASKKASGAADESRLQCAASRSGTADPPFDIAEDDEYHKRPVCGPEQICRA